MHLAGWIPAYAGIHPARWPRHSREAGTYWASRAVSLAYAASRAMASGYFRVSITMASVRITTTNSASACSSRRRRAAARPSSWSARRAGSVLSRLRHWHDPPAPVGSRYAGRAPRSRRPLYSPPMPSRPIAAIAGVAESDEIGVVPGKSAFAHHAEAARNALADAGLSRADVDGLLTAGYANYDLADYLGIAPRYTDTTTIGGASFVAHVGHAANAIASGLCEVALITHGQAGRSSRAPVPPRPQPSRRNVRNALRHDRHADQLRDGRLPLSAPLRRRARQAGHGRDRRGDAQVGATQPQSADARPDVVRRLSRLPVDRLAVSSPRLLPRDRRGRRNRANVRRARPQPSPSAPFSRSATRSITITRA